MDFVGELSELEGFHAIFIVIHGFTKVHTYIVTKITWIAADIANAYFINI